MSPGLSPGGGSPERGPGWLLLRRDGCLWALDPRTLARLERRNPPRLELKDGATLAADEVLTLTRDLVAHPVPRAAQPWLETRLHGLAVWHGEPVVLLEPGAPPPQSLLPDVQPETNCP